MWIQTKRKNKEFLKAILKEDGKKGLTCECKKTEYIVSIIRNSTIGNLLMSKCQNQMHTSIQISRTVLTEDENMTPNVDGAFK